MAPLIECAQRIEIDVLAPTEQDVKVSLKPFHLHRLSGRIRREEKKKEDGTGSALDGLGRQGSCPPRRATNCRLAGAGTPHRTAIAIVDPNFQPRSSRFSKAARS